MADGMEMAFNAILRWLKLDPEQVKSQLAGTRQIIVELDSRLKGIEQDLAAIKVAVGIGGENGGKLSGFDPAGGIQREGERILGTLSGTHAEQPGDGTAGTVSTGPSSD